MRIHNDENCAYSDFAGCCCCGALRITIFADVEAFDDNIMCDFTVIGWTKQSLIDRKLAKNNFDDLQIKVKNHCSGKAETLQLAIGSGNILYSKDTGVVRVDGSFKNPGDKDWTIRNLNKRRIEVR